MASPMSGVIEGLQRLGVDLDDDRRGTLPFTVHGTGRIVAGALKLGLTAPFNIDDVSQVIRGDYVNVSAVLDLTLSTIDNTTLTGTGFSGALRALEQSWGRNPDTMIPDVRYTPNPNDAPGGPLVERGE